MEISSLIAIFQVILSLLLIVLVLLQGGGAGLSSSFSGFGNYYSTKRGFDRYMFLATILIAIIFCVLSLIALIVK